MFGTGIIQGRPYSHDPIATSRHFSVALFGNSVCHFKKSHSHTCSASIGGCTLYSSNREVIYKWPLPSQRFGLVTLKECSHLYDVSVHRNRELNSTLVSSPTFKVISLARTSASPPMYRNQSYMSLQDMARSHCRAPVSSLQGQLTTPGIGIGCSGRSGTIKSCFKGISDIPGRTFFHKVLRHGRGLIGRKLEGTASELGSVLFLTVNLRFVSFPGTSRNSYLRTLLLGPEQPHSLDQGNGGNIWGGNGNRNRRTRDEGAGDENPYPDRRKFYLLWGVYTSIAWILFRWWALHYGIREAVMASISQCAVSVLWLGLLWCLFTCVAWTARMPLQLLCRYSPVCIRDRVPFITEFSKLRLHESMARNFGLVPNFGLSWFFVSDLYCSLRQVVGRKNMKTWQTRGDSGGELDRKRSSRFTSARKRGGSAKKRLTSRAKS